MESGTRKLLEYLFFMGACSGARKWIREEGFTTIEQAWRNCTNASWMGWYIKATATGRHIVISATDEGCQIVAYADTDNWDQYVQLITPALHRCFEEYRFDSCSYAYFMAHQVTPAEYHQFFECPPTVDDVPQWVKNLSDTDLLRDYFEVRVPKSGDN